jgi:hypothetical protein|tara:strand:- start:177 stop:785 length:609 start_codon:yes stop_codon:yes gene_type:complete
MELNELKEIWQNEQNKLLTRLEINEKRVNEITVHNSKNKLEKYINISIVGRNLALLYFIISIWFASKVLNDLLYSLPAIFGGLAMLFSFFQHISLKKANYSSMNIVELQKTIHKFRIHTLKYSKFDKGIVGLWLLTLSPIYLKLFFKISIFSNQNHFVIFILITIGISLLVKIFPFDIYKKWDLELNEAEIKLNEIKDFEIE